MTDCRMLVLRYLSSTNGTPRDVRPEVSKGEQKTAFSNLNEYIMSE
jgi:hypothetical protein